MSVPAGRRLAAAGIAGLLAMATNVRSAEPPPALSAKACSDSADANMLAGRYHVALGWLERVERIAPATNAGFEGAYATALGNTAVEARIVGGIPIPVVRSSVERVALLRTAVARIDAGERKARGPVEVRDLRVVRAGQLAFWGFVREAYQEYWSAHDAAPLDDRLAGQAGWLEARFRDPR